MTYWLRFAILHRDLRQRPSWGSPGPTRSQPTPLWFSASALPPLGTGGRGLPHAARVRGMVWSPAARPALELEPLAFDFTTVLLCTLIRRSQGLSRSRRCPCLYPPEGARREPSRLRTARSVEG